MQVQVIMFIKYDIIMGSDTDACLYFSFEIISVLALSAFFGTLLRGKCHPTIEREDLKSSSVWFLVLTVPKSLDRLCSLSNKTLCCALFILVFWLSKAMHKFNENLLSVELISNSHLIQNQYLSWIFLPGSFHDFYPPLFASSKQTELV